MRKGRKVVYLEAFLYVLDMMIANFIALTTDYVSSCFPFVVLIPVLKYILEKSREDQKGPIVVPE